MNTSGFNFKDPKLGTCTVVGNPGGGGGVLGFFGRILLRGVLGVVRKSGGGGGSCYISFLFGSF